MRFWDGWIERSDPDADSFVMHTSLLPWTPRGDERSRGSEGHRVSRAFTLIEVLVVIAVIGILAGLTTTGLNRAKARARQVQCMSIVSQHGLSLLMYAQEHSVFPLHAIRILRALQATLGSAADGAKMWNCPSALTQKAMRLPEELNTGHSQIGYNVSGLGDPARGDPLGISAKVSDGVLVPVSIGDIAAPSSLIMVGDGIVGANGEYLDSTVAISRQPVQLNKPSTAVILSATKRTQRRHDGRLNIVFGDGHSEVMTLNELFESNAPQALSRWNRDNLPHPERRP